MSPSEAGHRLCLWPAMDPQLGGCTRWPAHWPASPARRLPLAHRPEAWRAFCGEGPVSAGGRAVTRLSSGSCCRAGGVWPGSCRTGRAAAAPHCFWLWGCRVWRGNAQQDPRKEPWRRVCNDRETAITLAPLDCKRFQDQHFIWS